MQNSAEAWFCLTEAWRGKALARYGMAGQGHCIVRRSNAGHWRGTAKQSIWQGIAKLWHGKVLYGKVW